MMDALQEEAASEPTTAAAGLSAAPDLDDDSDWEYEYSHTETETFYLTVELSHPEFKDPAPRAHHHSRSGYYRSARDQGGEEIHNRKRPLQEGDEDGESDKQVATEAEPQMDLQVDDDDALDDDPDDDMRAVHPSLRVGDNGNVGEEGRNKERAAKGGNWDQNRGQPDLDMSTEGVQILDLHSDRPVVSYRGRVFQGAWAEMAGTEMIMADGNDGGPRLPALRNLAEGVDLLGAVSSRILTTEKLLEPRVAEVDTLAAIRDEFNIRVNSRADKTGQRVKQARFLENLIALKKKKGEPDHVTVYAKDGEGKDFKDSRDPDYKVRFRRKTGPPRGKRTVGVQGQGQYRPVDDAVRPSSSALLSGDGPLSKRLRTASRDGG